MGDGTNNRPMLAAGLVLVAMTGIGFADNLVPWIAEGTGLWQFHAMRAAMALMVLGVLGALGVVRLSAHRRWAVALRGGLAGASMLVYFGALAFLPIGQVAAGMFSAPIWILLVSRFGLRRPVGALRWAIALLGFLGVLLVLELSPSTLRPLTFVPLAAGILYAMGALATRELCEGESAAAMLAWFFVALGLAGLGGMVVLGLFGPEGATGFVTRGPGWPTPFALALTAVQAVAALLGVGLLFRAYQLGEAALVGLFEYALLIFAAFWAFVLHGTGVSAQAALGMVLVIAAGVAMTLADRRAP